MESHDKPKVTPVMALKALGLVISMGLGFADAFYAGYHHLPYVLAPCIFLEVSCTTCFVLINRYLKGRLFQGQTPNTMKGSFFLGCVLLGLSAVGSLVFAVTGFGKIKGYVYEDYGLYAALTPSLLAVFWSCVLIYDSRYYWKMWQRVVNNAMAARQVQFHP